MPLTDEEARRRLEAARAARGGGSTTTLSDEDARQRLAAAREPAASTLDVLRELPRAAGRGINEAFEFVGDVADVVPFVGEAVSLPGAIASLGRGGTAEDLLERIPRETPLETWQRDIQEHGVLGGVWESVKRPFTQESAGDRLRSMAHEAARPLTERRMPKGSPVQEGVVRGTEFASSAAALPLGGTLRGALTAAGISGVGGGAGKAVAEATEMGPGGTAAMELGGTFGALIIASAVRRIPGAVEKLQRWAGKVDELEIPDSVRRLVIRDMKRAAADPDAFTRLESRIEGGDIGTLGSLSDDPGLRAVEVQARAANAATKAQAEQILKEADEQAVSRLRAVVPGEEARATQAPMARSIAAQEQAERLRGAQASRAAAQGERVLEQAEEAERAARAAVSPRGTLEEAGQTVDDVVAGARERARDLESAAWSQVPQGERIAASPVKDALKRFLDEMSATKRRAFTRKFSTIIDDVDQLGDEVTGVELNDLRGNVSGAISEASKQGIQTTDADRFATRLAKVINQVVDDAKGGEAFTRAREASSKRFQIFDRGPLGRARAQAARAGTPAALGEKTVPPGTRGGQIADAALEVEEFTPQGEMRSAMEDVLRAQFAAARNPSTWLRQRRAVLERFSGLRKELETAAQAGETATELGRRVPRAQAAQERELAARAAERTRRIRGSAVGKFEGESGVKAARDVMHGKFPRRDTQQLVKTAERAGGTALDDLRAAYIEAYLDDVLDVAGEVQKGAAGKLARDTPAMQAALTPSQWSRVQELAQRLDRTWRSSQVLAEAAGKMGGAKAPWYVTALARLGGAKVFGALTGAPLLSANMSTAAVKRILESKPNEQYARLISHYVLNPKEYADDVQRLTKKIPPEEAARVVNRIFQRAMLGTAAAVEEG